MKDKTKIDKYLNYIASFLYEVMEKNRKVPFRNTSNARKRREELQCLEPWKSGREIEKQYMIKKIRLIMLIVISGFIIIFFCVLNYWNSGILTDGKSIERKSYGRGDLNTTLMAKVMDETLQKEKIEILVNERKYTEKELEKLYDGLVEKLEDIIPEDNGSKEEITVDIPLPTYLPEFPFRILWETSDYTLLNPDGTLGERKAEEKGEKVLLTANITYFDWKRNYQKEIRVFPAPVSQEEEWKTVLAKEVEKENLNTATFSSLQLPNRVGGKDISWREVKDNPIPGLILLLCGVILAVSLGMDQDLRKKVEERKKEMRMDYPEIVSKLSLYIGAGMSIRRAWQRIAGDYARQRIAGKRYAYEEILLTSHEMESGIPEGKSYDNFAKRCQVQNYLKLGTLLSQNLKKGSGNIQAVLQSESRAAFEERKSEARKMGEEAGTKLLFPMMLMLGVVMIVVIIPAFLSFSV